MNATKPYHLTDAEAHLLKDIIIVFSHDDEATIKCAHAIEMTPDDFAETADSAFEKLLRGLRQTP